MAIPLRLPGARSRSRGFPSCRSSARRESGDRAPPSGLVPAASLLAGRLRRRLHAPLRRVDDLRVIALVTSPLEVGPAEDVTSRPTRSRRRGGDPDRAVDLLPPVGRGERRRTPAPCRSARCRSRPAPIAPSSPIPGTWRERASRRSPVRGKCPATVPDQLVTVIRYVATSDSGQTREAVQRLTLYTKADPTARNHAPSSRTCRSAGGTCSVARPRRRSASASRSRSASSSIPPAPRRTWTPRGRRSRSRSSSRTTRRPAASITTAPADRTRG